MTLTYELRLTRAAYRRLEHKLEAIAPDGEVLATLEWERTGEILCVTVWDEVNCRKGIATALWNAAQTAVKGCPARHSAERSPSGDAWARAVGGEVPPLAEGLGGESWSD